MFFSQRILRFSVHLTPYPIRCLYNNIFGGSLHFLLLRYFFLKIMRAIGTYRNDLFYDLVCYLHRSTTQGSRSKDIPRNKCSNKWKLYLPRYCHIFINIVCGKHTWKQNLHLTAFSVYRQANRYFEIDTTGILINIHLIVALFPVLKTAFPLTHQSPSISEASCNSKWLSRWTAFNIKWIERLLFCFHLLAMVSLTNKYWNISLWELYLYISECGPVRATQYQQKRRPEI